MSQALFNLFTCNLSNLHNTEMETADIHTLQIGKLRHGGEVTGPGSQPAAV